MKKAFLSCLLIVGLLLCGCQSNMYIPDNGCIVYQGNKYIQCRPKSPLLLDVEYEPNEEVGFTRTFYGFRTPLFLFENDRISILYQERFNFVYLKEGQSFPDPYAMRFDKIVLDGRLNAEGLVDYDPREATMPVGTTFVRLGNILGEESAPVYGLQWIFYLYCKEYPVLIVRLDVYEGNSELYVMVDKTEEYGYLFYKIAHEYREMFETAIDAYESQR